MLVSPITVLRKSLILTTEVEIDNADALANYYRLLLFITRLIVSVVLSRGTQNDQAIQSSRAFLADNRALVVATFKRQAKIGGVSFDDAGVNIDELVELFTLLISMTDFLNVRYPSLRGCYLSLELMKDCSMRSEQIPKHHVDWGLREYRFSNGAIESGIHGI